MMGRYRTTRFPRSDSRVHERPSESTYVIQQLVVGVLVLNTRHRRVVEESRLQTSTVLVNLHVEAVVAGVEDTVGNHLQ